ncbi:hypothetical protein Hanom_Chr07g00623921 [Helianthus anomalus]
MEPIRARRPLLHDLHLVADDRPGNKDNGQDTWIHSACASYPLTWKHQRSWQRGHHGYSLLSTTGPRPISQSPSQTTSAINSELHLQV